MAYDSVLINGTVGVGKSTAADALGSLLAEERVPHAVIDLDQLRRSWPAPADDPFNHELELSNLAAVARNYRAAGARRFVLAGVVEHRDEIQRYRTALASSGLFVCRITARADVVDARIARRHADDPEGLVWHRTRAVELESVLHSAALDDALLDASAATPYELAAAIREAAGW